MVTRACGGVVQVAMLDTRLTGVVQPGVGPEAPLSPKRGACVGAGSCATLRAKMGDEARKALRLEPSSE